MTTYRIPCAKCKQESWRLESEMMDSCTATLLASRRDGKRIKNTILSPNSDVTWIRNSQESPHLGEIKRIVNNVYQLILCFSSARDEASILVCDDYVAVRVEIEHSFEHITTFEAPLHKPSVRVGRIILFGKENPDKRDAYHVSWLCTPPQSFRKEQTVHSEKRAKFCINFLAFYYSMDEAVIV